MKTAPNISPSVVTCASWDRIVPFGLLIGLCLVLFGPGLFTLPVFDRDEAYFAQASRQMVQSGDFVDIHFQDQTRYRKPIGIYWLQAASVMMFGDMSEPVIWPYRLPSLFGAIIAVLLTAWLGQRLVSTRVGLLAGVILASSVVLGVEARMAKTDAVLLAAIVLSQLALAVIYSTRDRLEKPSCIIVATFWLALGGAILIKGPVGPMISGLTLLGLFVWDRRIRWWGRLRWGMGLTCLVVLTAPWFLVIAMKSQGDFFTASLGEDFFAKVLTGRESKGFAPGYYLLTYWVTFAPFTFLSLLAVPWIWRQRQDTMVRFCLAWIVPNWLVFELVATKLLHYTLPTFPAIAILTAAAVCDYFGRRRDHDRTSMIVGLVALGSLLIGGIAMAVMVVLPWVIDGRIDIWGVITTLGVLTIVSAMTFYSRSLTYDRMIVLCTAAMAILYGVTYQYTLPSVRGIWMNREVAHAVSSYQRCPDSVTAMAGFREPSLVFYLGVQTIRGNGSHAAAHLRRDPACGLAVVEAREEQNFHQALDGLSVIAVTRLQEGLNYTKGQKITLTLYRVQE